MFRQIEWSSECVINNENLGRKWVAIIISGFSWVWKDMIIRKYIETNESVCKAVSVTSRQQREWETHALDYYFYAKSRVEALLNKWELLDSFQSPKWDIYWVPRDELKKLRHFRSVFFNVIPQSWKIIRRLEPENSLEIILVPKSFEEWRERLMNRKDWMTTEEKKNRISQDLNDNFHEDIADIEKSMKNWRYHYNGKKFFVINEDWKMENAVETLKEIVSLQLKTIMSERN